ncbi:helix-turn-helix domain-containing protein [Spirosoma panaciterrae]|uniref:helix-turn-helix domain-containing protein n=1 Tax=Spirosoma panaciterrae TaxID=496058 RepID=UPI00037E621E|nr:helix-turn-helix domain-containing protein [Spirosoma panaciterrae]
MNTTGSDLLDELNKLIDQRLEDPSFSLETICQHLGVSRSQLYRIIKDETQLSTTRYLRKRRLLKTRELLLETDLRISEICDRVGLTSPQNLSTYFAEEFGLSPTEFRKNHRPEAAEFLTAPTDVPAPDSPVPTLPDATQAPMGRIRSPRWKLWLGAGLGLLILIVLGIYGLKQTDPTPLSEGPAINSLALLPFVNLGDAESGPACEGVMDEIYASVALLKNLTVIARSSSDQYRNTPKTGWQIGDELHVAHLLKGSVLKTGRQLQVKLELVGTQDDIREWQKVYKGDYATLFSMTDQMVRDVTAQLNQLVGSARPPSVGASSADSLTGSVALARQPARTRNLAAYNLFLQGRQLVVERTHSGLTQSLKRFDEALQLDSTFAEAYAYKATAYMLLWVLNYADAKATYGPAEQAALTAIRLDPSNSTAYGALGSLYHNSYQWKAAENAFRIGLQHSPNDAQLLYWYGLLLRSVGRLPEAVRYSQRAIELDPLYPVMLTGHIINCVFLGDKAKAQAAIRSGEGFFDKAFIYYLGKGYYYLGQGDYSQAYANFNTLHQLNPAYKNYESAAMFCQARQGKRTEALAWLTHLPNTPRADYDRAVVFAGLAEKDSCLHYLKKAADGGFYHRDMKLSPLFKPYRNHPIFRAILHQYQLN